VPACGEHARRWPFHHANAHRPPTTRRHRHAALPHATFPLLRHSAQTAACRAAPLSALQFLRVRTRHHWLPLPARNWLQFPARSQRTRSQRQFTRRNGFCGV
jgi:hypothetical protein